MIRAVLALFMFLAGGIAAANDLPVLLEARHPGGAVLQLHEAFGPCVDGARTATYIAPGGGA